jgi:PAS domain S-box-containing protein
MRPNRGSCIKDFNAILQGIPDVVYRLDTNGKVTFINEAVRKYGFLPEQLKGVHILDLVHPQDRKKATYRLNERRSGSRSTKSLEIKLFSHLKIVESIHDEIQKEAASEPIFLVTAEGKYGSGEPQVNGFAGTQGIARDITAVKEAQNDLENRADFLHQVLESLPHPFYVINVSDYTISMANSAAGFSALSEYTTCHLLTHRRNEPCNSKEHPCPLKRIMRTKKPVTVEHVHYDKESNSRDVEIHAYPVFDSQGNLIQIIESVMDITDRKQSEREREKLILDLEKALAQVKTLSGLLPICAKCKRIRDDKGYWEQIEVYIREHSEAEFSHSICPECAAEIYGEFYRKGK